MTRARIKTRLLIYTRTKTRRFEMVDIVPPNQAVGHAPNTQPHSGKPGQPMPAMVTYKVTFAAPVSLPAPGAKPTLVLFMTVGTNVDVRAHVMHLHPGCVITSIERFDPLNPPGDPAPPAK